MQKSTLALTFFSFCFGTAVAGPLAFPEALGFGANATGGRGGTVYHVTNLDDSGTGSFRDAVSKPNRIVVFDVGGYITIKSAVSISSNITIAGQTAPGEGIGIKGGKLSTGKQSNIIIRYLRIRPGSGTASVKDDGLNLYDAHNIIVDHTSVEFAPWNNFGGSSDDWQTYPVTDITIQNCLIANPIYQQFGAHIESVNGYWSWYYNAFANTHNRNPLDKVNDVFVNNVHYDFEAGYTTHTSTSFKHDIVNNYFVYGPNGKNPWFQIDKNQTIYASGNLIDTNRDGVLNGGASSVYWYQGEGTVLSEPWSELTTSNPILSAPTAWRLVNSQSGVLPYDDIDSLVWYQMSTLGSAGQLYTSETQTGLSNDGWGEIHSGEKPTDTDGDGIPDFFEFAMGYNALQDDAMTLASDGYAYIEKYINWLGAMHMSVPQNGSSTFDLRTITKGFQSVSPAYTVSSAENGSVTLASDGYSAVFTPTPNFTGLASFKYTVKGSDGTEYTGRVEVLVEESDYVIGPSIVLQSGSAEQSIMLGESIQSVTYKYLGCGGVQATELPNGISAKINTTDSLITLEGVPTDAGVFSYTIVTTDDGGETATVKGSITVRAMATIATGQVDFLSSVNAAYPNDGIGAYEESNAGWIDSGYYNFANSLDSYGAWNLNVPTAKNEAVLNIRYANGGGTARDMELFINGKSAGIVAFPVTADWTTYDSVSVQVNLSQGVNVLRLKSLTEKGGPNVDEFRFNVAGVSQIQGEVIEEAENQEDEDSDGLIVGSTVPLRMVTSASFDFTSGVLRTSHSAYVRVSVFDMQGRMMANFAGNVPAGATKLDFSKKTLPHARYQVRVQVK
ncbi:MAG: carbohydrate-binding protein [Fibrobacter sp.]|nr:carbohydrate-binding protein [Fibrobacter sp.]